MFLAILSCVLIVEDVRLLIKLKALDDNIIVKATIKDTICITVELKVKIPISDLGQFLLTN